MNNISLTEEELALVVNGPIADIQDDLLKDALKVLVIFRDKDGNECVGELAETNEGIDFAPMDAHIDEICDGIKAKGGIKKALEIDFGVKIKNI